MESGGEVSQLTAHLTSITSHLGFTFYSFFHKAVGRCSVFLLLSSCLCCLRVSALVHADVHCVDSGVFFRLCLHNTYLRPWHGYCCHYCLPLWCADYFVFLIIVIPRLPVSTQHPVSWIDWTFIHHTVTQLCRKMGSVRVELAPSSGRQWYCRKNGQLHRKPHFHRVPLLENCSSYSAPALQTHCNSSWSLLCAGKTRAFFR